MSSVQIGRDLISHYSTVFFQQVGVSIAFSCCHLEGNMKELPDMSVKPGIILDVSNSRGGVRSRKCVKFLHGKQLFWININNRRIRSTKFLAMLNCITIDVTNQLNSVTPCFCQPN